MKIKDFIITEVKENKETCKIKKRHKPTEITYEVVLENEIDFVIRRKTSRTSKLLVFLITQNQFYIKNEKNGEIETINKESLLSFGISYNQHYSAKGPIYKEKFFNKVNWIILYKDLTKVSKSKKIQTILKKGIHLRPLNTIEQNYLLISEKLFDYCCEKLNMLEDKNYNRSYKYNFIFEVCEKINYNKALEIIDLIIDSNVNCYKYEMQHILRLVNTYNLDLTRLMKYYTCDLYIEGISSIASAYNIHKDYLEMSIGYYGKIKEKYPKYLKVEHDRINLKYNFLNTTGKENSFKIRTEENEYLSYSKEDYCIVIPKKCQDLITEGHELNHCLSSYIDRVIKKQSRVVFLRLKEDIETPLLSIELSPIKDTIVQWGGFDMRKPNKEESKFIKSWMENKNLKCIYKGYSNV